MADEKRVAALIVDVRDAMEQFVTVEDDEIEQMDEEEEIEWESGVEAFQTKSIDDMWKYLGLPGAIPLFNSESDPDGVVDPWSDEWAQFAASDKAEKLVPRWHQLVGMAKLMERCIEGEPVMLMDEVGVGKTMQIVGAIALYAIYREYFAMHGKFPGHFSELVSLKV